MGVSAVFEREGQIFRESGGVAELGEVLSGRGDDGQQVSSVEHQGDWNGPWHQIGGVRIYYLVRNGHNPDVNEILNARRWFAFAPQGCGAMGAYFPSEILHADGGDAEIRSAIAAYCGIKGGKVPVPPGVRMWTAERPLSGMPETMIDLQTIWYGNIVINFMTKKS